MNARPHPMARMHLKAAVALTVCLLLLANDAWTRDYQARKKKNGYTVDMLISRNPPVLGDNAVRIRIADPDGRFLSDAQVMVNYYMPPMPGMPPMNYTIAAQQDGEFYRATMDLIMTGPWNIIIKVRKEAQSLTVTFPIDVR